jgi:GNAT superfamily N-acetyltransferase
MSDYRIRRATLADAAAIARQRVRMFLDMGELEEDEAPTVELATLTRLNSELASGEYLGWLAEANGEVVAGAGVLLHAYYPNGPNPRGRPTAYILNVYTEPAHRDRGLARQLVVEILGWCRAHEVVRASLHSSRAGRPVYRRLGFAATNEMRVNIPPVTRP